MRRLITIWFFFLAGSLPVEKSFPGPGQRNSDGVLQWYKDQSVRVTSVALRGPLREVSGLAMSTDGRLFTHNDEYGIVYQIDPVSGEALKQFQLGPRILRVDFEGIEIIGDRFFLVTSNGTLYEFSERQESGSVHFKIHKTGLSGDHDVEGLCYDPETNALLLACKGDPGKKYGEAKAIYAFSLETMELEKKPRFLLRSSALKELLGQKNFRPTAIARHPASGSFFVLSSVGPWLIEVSPSGQLMNYVRLSPVRHGQPEGLAIGPDNTMYIADEGYVRGKLTRYMIE